jgi:hypothetical protein
MELSVKETELLKNDAIQKLSQKTVKKEKHLTIKKKYNFMRSDEIRHFQRMAI